MRKLIKRTRKRGERQAKAIIEIINPRLWNVGDLIRGVSALAVIIGLVGWYLVVKDYIFWETVGDLSVSLTAAIALPLGLYGFGEGYNFVYKLLKCEKKHGGWMNYIKIEMKKYFVDIWSEVLKAATIYTPLIAYLTNNDFFISILIPSAISITGHTIGYLNRFMGGRQFSLIKKRVMLIRR